MVSIGYGVVVLTDFGVAISIPRASVEGTPRLTIGKTVDLELLMGNSASRNVDYSSRPS